MVKPTNTKNNAASPTTPVKRGKFGKHRAQASPATASTSPGKHRGSSSPSTVNTSNISPISAASSGRVKTKFSGMSINKRTNSKRQKKRNNNEQIADEDDDPEDDEEDSPEALHIEWLSEFGVKKALLCFKDEKELRNKSYNEMIEMLSECFTPSEMKVAYTVIAIAAGMDRNKLNLKGMTTKKFVKKAMSKLVIEVVNMQSEVDVGEDALMCGVPDNISVKK